MSILLFISLVLQSHDQVLGVSDRSPPALLLILLKAHMAGLLGGWVLREEADLAFLGLCLSSLLPPVPISGPMILMIKFARLFIDSVNLPI